jgi:hypothetical protein
MESNSSTLSPATARELKLKSSFTPSGETGGLSEKGAASSVALESAPANFEPEYPEGVRLVLLTVALAISVFLVALDNTIIATAIPKITDHFKSLDDVGWYGSAYVPKLFVSP